MLSRRSFIKNTVLAGTASAIFPHVANADSAPPGNRNQRVLRVAHITDVHLLPMKLAEENFSKVMRGINSLKDKPDFIINTGDSVMDENKQLRETVESSWTVWNRVVQRDNSLRIYSALGNHDVWYGPDETTDATYKLDKRYGKQWAIEALSLPGRYYSFEKNGWVFIALDSINGDPAYQLDEVQYAWLEQELIRAGKQKHVCIFSHVPIISIAAHLLQSKAKRVDGLAFPVGLIHNDHQRLKNLFYKSGNVRFCLSGHVHYIDDVNFLGVRYLCNGAVCGNWWRSPLAFDEFSPVYTLIDLYNDGTIRHEHVFYNSGV